MNDMMPQNDMPHEYDMLPQNDMLHEYHEVPAYENLTQNAQLPVYGQFAANARSPKYLHICEASVRCPTMTVLSHSHSCKSHAWCGHWRRDDDHVHHRHCSYSGQSRVPFSTIRTLRAG